MGETIKFDGKYIDAEGVYDFTLRKTQSEINAQIKIESFDGTTDAHGNVSLTSYSGYNHCVIGAIITSPSYASYRFCTVGGSAPYLKIGTNSANDDPYVGSVSGYVYYI